MRSEPYQDELHTFRGDTEQRRHRRNGRSSCAMDERRCRYDMMMTVTIIINRGLDTKPVVVQIQSA